MKSHLPGPRLQTAAIALLGMMAISACAEQLGPTAPLEETPSNLERVSSEEVNGVPGFPLLDSIAVRALDANGAPAAGVSVTFAAENGGAVSPSTVVTGTDGIARARWLLGGAEGNQRLTASTAGSEVPLTFQANASRGSAAALEILAGDTGSLPVGCPVAEPLRVRVTDSAGQPVAGTLVLFRRPSETAMQGRVVQTDANGEASLQWQVSASSEEVVAEIAAEGADAAFTISGVPVAPNGYATSGNRIYNSDCEVHRFVGVARPGLQWWPSDARLSDATTATAEFREMKSWGANIVRIPLYQRYWLADITLDGVNYPSSDYRRVIRETVDRATAEGLSVILDLHNSDRGDPNFPTDVADIQQMADVAHSIPFWEQVAAEYKDDGQVIFQLYTEPNQIEWETWRDGGMIPAGETFPPQSSGVAFEAAGMQDLYEAVRNAGANNLVIINGMHWGYDLSRVPEYAIDGYNIVYATHPYDYPDKQPDVWWDDWGFVSEQYPVMIAEFGDYTCNEDGYYDSVLDFADQHQLSWVAWAWFAPPSDQPDQICGFPALLTDWNGTASPTGQIVKARMQSYR